MRSLICAALLLLAGCISDATETTNTNSLPDSKDHPASPTSPNPLVIAEAFANDTFANYTGIYGIGVSGSSPASWNAGPALGLPQALASLVLEMRCEEIGGTASDAPGLVYRMEIRRGNGNIEYWMGGGGYGDCSESRHFDSQRLGEGTLVSLHLEATADLVTYESSFDVHFAATILNATSIPVGYSAFP